MATLKEVQGFGGGYSKLLLKLSFTDAYYSNPVFYISDSHLLSTNVSTGPPTYPLVVSWGAFTKDAMRDGNVNESVGELTLYTAGKMAPMSSVANYELREWMRLLNFYDAVVELYLWNQLATTQALVWRGYIANISSTKARRGEVTTEFLLSSLQKSIQATTLGSLVTKADFANAPLGSIGGMVNLVYGRLDNNVFSGASRNSLAWMGFPMPGVRGIIVDENKTNVQVTHRLCRNDGTNAAHTFAEPTADDPSTPGDLWIYDSSLSAYGMVDGASYAITNDTSKLEVVVDSSPKVFFFIRPSMKGSTNASGFTDLYKLINSDPSDYVESTASDHIWSFACPEVSLNARIKSISLVIDADNVHPSKDRKIRFGFWDVYKTGAAGYTNGVATDLTKATGSSRSLVFMVTRVKASDFRDHLGSDTFSEFSSGRFLTRDTGDLFETNVEIRAEIIDLGGLHSGFDQVRIRGIGLMVEVEYPNIPRYNSHIWVGPGAQKKLDESIANNPYATHKRLMEERALRRLISSNLGMPAELVRASALSTLSGTDFFGRGIYAKDDGGGTFTGTGSGPITIPVDVARHMLVRYGGETVNSSAGTLGNFEDARATTQPMFNLDDTFIQFGPQEVKLGQGLNVLCSRFPMELHKDKSGSWNVFPDDLNPHSSRNYRSTSEDVYIEKNDIDLEDFEVTTIPWEKIQNSVVFNYSHGYPNRDAAASYVYNNPLSQMYFGVKEKLIRDEPWVLQDILGGAASGSAQVMAEWLGRRNARPRQIVQVGLSQKFYDLEVGHVLEFKGIEAAGLYSQAFRCGLLDYQFQSLSGATNYADSAAPLYIAASGSSRILFGMSQQVSSITFPAIAVAAGYTVVGAADGSDAWDYLAIGAAWTALTGVTNGNALKSTGRQTVSFTRPRADLIPKQELTVNGVVCGPCYWYSMEYSTATATGSGTARTEVPAVWEGRRFINKRIMLPAMAKGKYPKRRAILMEVM